MEKIGEKINSLRKENKMSQEKLAEKLGITRQSVSKWESGNTFPDIENIILLAKTFNITTDYLLGLGPRKAEKEIVEVEKEVIVEKEIIVEKEVAVEKEIEKEIIVEKDSIVDEEIKKILGEDSLSDEKKDETIDYILKSVREMQTREDILEMEEDNLEYIQKENSKNCYEDIHNLTDLANTINEIVVDEEEELEVNLTEDTMEYDINISDVFRDDANEDPRKFIEGNISEDYDIPKDNINMNEDIKGSDEEYFNIKAKDYDEEYIEPDEEVDFIEDESDDSFNLGTVIISVFIICLIMFGLFYFFVLNN